MTKLVAKAEKAEKAEKANQANQAESINRPTKPLFRKIAFLGLGLIGSSLARAVNQLGLAQGTSGYVRRAETRLKVEALGLVDHIASHPADAVAGADLVMYCTPLSAYTELSKAIASSLESGVIISDVGSTKESVLNGWRDSLPSHCQLIPGHPVAGTENSGPDAGFAELFQGRYCILTPPPDADKLVLDKMIKLWQTVGSMVEIMTPTHHDRVLAITSHLPHVIAYTIVRTAADLETHLRAEKVANPQLVQTGEVMRFSAGGFRDFTRIAGSDPVMWRDVFLNNREAVLEMLGRFSEDLLVLQRAIRLGDGAALEEWFTSTRAIRRGIVELKQAGSFNAAEPKPE